MPHDLPAATVTTEQTVARPLNPDETKFSLPKGSHVEPLYKAADQDGHDGEIVCRFRGVEILIHAQFLKL